MIHGARSRVAWTLAALLWLLGLGVPPLFESTEGRYASIAAAMQRDGDWLEPRFNGLLHLTKPPLAYWAGALGLAVLPDGEFAVRLPAGLAWLVAGWLVYRIARALGLDPRRSLWASAFASLAPLPVVQGRMLSSDIFLAVGVLAVWYGVLAGGPIRRRALWVGGGMAIGWLAKGHMILFWTWLPLAPWALLTRRRALLAPLVHPVAVLLAGLLALPWFVVELGRHPGLLGYWLRGETARRYLSTAHGRQEPWWYFLAVLPAAVLPWLPELLAGLRRRVWRGTPLAICGVWVLLPLVLLSASGSKRPNYLLPLVAPLALIAAAGLGAAASRSLRWRGAIWLLVALASPLAFVLKPAWAPPTRTLVQAAAAGGGPLAAYRVMPSSLSFYHGGPVPVVDRLRADGFDPDSTRNRWAPTHSTVLAGVLGSGGAVLARAKDQTELERALARSLRPAARAGELVLLRAGGDR